ncbi:MAG: PAS domain S-box protein, partial [Methanolinea sp.]|nr:PAS domain S-box protein [Methanolinea sp.]
TKRRQAEEALAASERQLRLITENMVDQICQIDYQRRISFASPSVERLMGYRPEELLGHPVTEYIHPEDTARVIREMWAAIEQQQSSIRLEYRFLHKDGKYRWFESETRILYDGEKRYVSAIFASREITDRKSIEGALRQSEERLKMALEASDDGLFDWNMERDTAYFSPRYYTMLGYDPEEFAASYASWDTLLHPDDREQVRSIIREYTEGTRENHEVEVRLRAKNGDWRWIRSKAKIVRHDSTDRPVRMVGIHTDITAQKEIEQTLREREELFRRVTEGAPEAIYIGVDWKFAYLNPAAVRLFGASSSEDLVGSPFMDRIHPEFHDIIRSRVHQIYEERIPVRVLEEVYIRLDGTAFDVEVSSVPFVYQGKEGALVFVRDISDRKQAEDALKSSEQQFRSVIENIQEGFLRSDAEGRVIMASPSAAHMFGFDSVEELVGTAMTDYYSNPQFRQTVLDQLWENGHVSEYEVEFRRRDGSVFIGSINAHFRYSADGEVGGTEGVIRDITERKLMENAIREANRKLNLLNSITWHDVKNQLTMLEGFAQIALMKKTDPEIEEYLTRIGNAARTISDQIEFTRTYQKLGVNSPEWFRIDDLIEKSGVDGVKYSSTCSRCRVFADPMFERVFPNLFENAFMHGGHVTEIVVRCEQTPEGLILTIQDDGKGVPVDEKEKIFDEGYGSHTGFGLFLVREILAITGISIRETGVPGEGARFEIHVPNEAFRFLPPEDLQN